MVSQDKPVHQDLLDQGESLAPLAHRDRQAPRDQEATEAKMELRELQATGVNQDYQDLTVKSNTPILFTVRNEVAAR